MFAKQIKFLKLIVVAETYLARSQDNFQIEKVTFFLPQFTLLKHPPSPLTYWIKYINVGRIFCSCLIYLLDPEKFHL